MSFLVYIGLGSNLNDPVKQIDSALGALKKLSLTEFMRTSSLYQTQPWGPIQDQPAFINAVAELTTQLEPQELLFELFSIEVQHGRRREERWGPRTLDLDVLLFGDRVIDEENLNVPHPRLWERDFVVYPLLELRPDLRLPDGRLLVDLAANLINAQVQTIQRLAKPGIINEA